MKVYYEWGAKQVHKHGEELCGDSLAVSRRVDCVTMALSDGLGSGVKANILATLTTQIAMHMLENGLSLDEVVQTLGETLPLCAVRKLAYSTFAIGQFFGDGAARVVEFDSPPAMLIRGDKAQPMLYDERCIKEKTIRESVFHMQTGDWIVFVSDGVLNAGIGGLYPLGWGWEQAARFVREHVRPQITAQELAGKIAEAVSELYVGAPGDDVSIVAIKARHKMVVTVLTGAPESKEKDETMIREFINRAGCHVVCGGTTAKIVSHYTGRPLDVDLSTMSAEVPPKGRIEGIDLVTEGILTLTKVSELLRCGAQRSGVKFQANGAADLLRLLLSMDEIHFLVGQAVNPAHQNPDLPHELEMRLVVVREIVEELRKRGIDATIESV